METNKPLEELVTELFTAHVEPVKDTKVITLDVVTTLFEEKNLAKIPTTTPKMYGFAVVDEDGTSGVLLPGTK